MPIGSEVNAIEFSRVSKRFRIQEGHTLREFVPAMLRGRGWSPPFYALREISFAIPRGQTLGIIGRNGSGKSTILKLTAGVMVPTQGQVKVQGRVTPLIELGAGFHPDLTGRENIYLNAAILGMSGKDIRDCFDDVTAFAEIGDFIDTPVKRYSSGIYMRLGFAVAVHSNPDILLVDEVLAVGDVGFRKKCLDKMQEFQTKGVTIVLVSHELDMVQQFCQRVLLLHDGQVVAEGEPEAAVKRYKELMAQTEPSTV